MIVRMTAAPTFEHFVSGRTTLCFHLPPCPTCNAKICGRWKQKWLPRKMAKPSCDNFLLKPRVIFILYSTGGQCSSSSISGRYWPWNQEIPTGWIQIATTKLLSALDGLSFIQIPQESLDQLTNENAVMNPNTPILAFYILTSLKPRLLRGWSP